MGDSIDNTSSWDVPRFSDGTISTVRLDSAPAERLTEISQETTQVVPRLTEGSFFGDTFKIHTTIANGNLSSVFHATHLRNNREVALKVLKGDRVKDPVSRGRLQREGQILSSLRHPNIVDIIDSAITTEGDLWIATEYLRGQTLQDRILRQGAISPFELAEILTQVVRGLDAAHKAGVTHRDLKPENIFLCENGEVKILDFGLSAADGSQKITVTGTVLGTPRYMAPEQLMSAKSASKLSDTYALGICVFEALAGDAPFEFSDYGQLLGVVAQGKHRPISNVDPNLKAFNPFFERALSLMPKDRFQSAPELLNEYLATCQDFSTREVRRVEMQRVVRRAKWWLMLALLGGGVLGAIATHYFGR